MAIWSTPRALVKEAWETRSLSLSRCTTALALRVLQSTCAEQANKKSPQEIDVWIQDNFRELGNAWQGNITELSRGMNCLWKGIKKGKNSGESTKYEYFNGIFNGWADDEFVIVS